METGLRPADGLHVEWVDDEAVVLNPETGDLHYLNPQAALVYALVLEYGYEEGLKELERAHGNAAGLEHEVDDLLRDMVEKGLLVAD